MMAATTRRSDCEDDGERNQQKSVALHIRNVKKCDERHARARDTTVGRVEKVQNSRAGRCQTDAVIGPV